MISILKNDTATPSLVFEARDGDEILGKITAECTVDLVEIQELTGTPFLFDGLCRALLSYAEKRDVPTARFAADIPSVLLTQGYTSEFDIKTFFGRKNCE